MSVILGLTAFRPGAAAALVIDGRPVAAIAEERLARSKLCAGFPGRAIRACLAIAGVRCADIDALAIGGSPPGGAAVDPVRLVAHACGVDPAPLRCRVHWIEHHRAHLASAYFVSPWEAAAGLSIDRSGDGVSAMLASCRDERIIVHRRIHLPHSLGRFYSTGCAFIGYDRPGDEGKVMGLAPYGSDRFVEAVAAMIEPTADGLRLDPRYCPAAMPAGAAAMGANGGEDGSLFTDAMRARFGEPRRRDGAISARDRDLAFALQRRFEEIYLHLLAVLHGLVPGERVAIAGGCALNSVANGKVFDHTPFRATCIPPAPGNDGLALGAALDLSNAVLKDGGRWVLSDAALGPEYGEAEIRAALDAAGVPHVRLERAALIEETADALAAGRVVGWFQGRMEWGPRALGQRSILAHPGLPAMRDVLNARIKRREAFRPFAPSVLAERQATIFALSQPSPFMSHVAKIRPEWRERLAAVRHVDDSARLHSVCHEANPLFYDLIAAFERRTGLPVLLNTSFNENEPIVCAPAEAIDCFRRTRMDVLAIGPFMCRKPADGSG